MMNSAMADTEVSFGRRVINSVLYRTGLRPAMLASPGLPRPSPKWVRVSGGPLRDCQLFLDPDSPTYWEREMLEGKFDPFIYEELKAHGGIEGATVWDIGAHIGYHSLAFAALAGQTGRVVSFEPNPFNLERFRSHLEKNPELASRITLLTSAVSNVDGASSFSFSPNVDDGTSSGSHLTEAPLPGESWEYEAFTETRVETVRADTLLESGLPAPDVIKIDTEGAEFLVLEGAKKLLSAHRPLVFVEVHHITLMLKVQQLMFDLDYRMKLLDAEHASNSRCFVVAAPV